MSAFAEAMEARPGPATASSSGSGRSASILVWGVWLAMLAGSLLFIARYGSNVPSWDDWDMVPVLTHHQPVTAEWLWSQHNEHRVPLPRLAMLALVRLTVLDFRVLMVADALVMGAMAAALILVARRLRGRASLADTFFPLALLHWGQAANLLWGWQLQFYASVVIASIALSAIALCGVALDPRRAGIAVGVSILLLPLCGANGLTLVPALALWLGYAAFLSARDPRAGGRRGALPLALLAIGAVLLVGLYLVGWERVPWHPRNRNPVWALLTALQFLTMGLGPATRGPWPLSGVLTVLVLGLTAWRLLRVWRREPAERLRAAGLLLFLAGVGCLGLALGLGRNGFETRYVTLAVPAWCCAYLAWTAYGRGSLDRRMPGVLAFLAAAALVPNSRFGVAYGTELEGKLGGFERDMAAGMPLHQLIARYSDWLSVHDDVPQDYLPMLRDAGVEPYRRLRHDPPLREVPVPLTPASTREVRWSDGTAALTGDNPSLEFALPADVYAAGIRLTYRFHDRRGTLPYVGIYWKRSDQPYFPPNRFQKYSPTGDRANWERGNWTRLDDPATTVTVWGADTLDRIRITPNFKRGGFFEIRSLVLLVPGP